jgi:hypothetical protein
MLRRVQLLDLAEQGKIPAPLLAMADMLLTSESVILTVESFQENAPVITLIAGACLAGPQGLEVEELPVADRLAIYNWANEVLVAVRPFRREPDRDAQPGGDGAGVRRPAIADPGRIG